MPRNYAAVPYEYLEEMEVLSDEEFGRLVRALLLYSRDGVEIPAEGNLKFYAKRVMGREERYIEQYGRYSESRRKAGLASAEKRRNNALPTYVDNTNTNTETEAKTKSKSNSNPNPPRGTPRRKGFAPAVPGEMEKCLKKDMDWLKEWSEQMGAQGENTRNITIDNGTNCG